MTTGGREEYFNQQQKLIEDQRLPWQREDWVDPYERYNRLQEEFRSFFNFQEITIVIREELERKLKEQQPHDWIKEGF
jgi:hypothetical protein